MRAYFSVENCNNEETIKCIECEYICKEYNSEGYCPKGQQTQIDCFLFSYCCTIYADIITSIFTFILLKEIDITKNGNKNILCW